MRVLPHAWNLKDGITRRITRLVSMGMKEPKIVPPEEGVAYFREYLTFRARAEFDSVVLITGSEGKGKSTLGLRLSEGTGWSDKTLCYTAEDLISAYETIRRAEPVFWDEAILGLLSTETFNTEQKAVIKALSLVRAKGATLYLCVPDIWLMAKQIRSRRATLWFHIKERGRAEVYERDQRLRFKPTAALRMTRYKLCPTVTWKPYPKRDSFWRSYYRNKMLRMNQALADLKEEILRAKDSSHPKVKEGENE